MKIVVENGVLVNVEVDYEKDIGVKEFAIPDGVTELANESLAHMPLEIETLYIPKSVKKIEEGALFGEGGNWEKLKNIIVEEDNKNYKSESGCLIDIKNKKVLLGTWNAKIPEGIEKIGIYAFREREDLTEIVIPDSVKEIDVQAIACCHNLRKVTVLGKDTNLDNVCFTADTAIEEFNLHKDSNYEFVEGCLIRKSDNALLMITDNGKIPSSVKRAELASIVRYFKDIEIPESIEEIVGMVIVLGGGKLKVKKDSAAHKYAVENNLPYEEI